jgi:hypothetical protein
MNDAQKDQAQRAQDDAARAVFMDLYDLVEEFCALELSDAKDKARLYQNMMSRAIIGIDRVIKRDLEDFLEASD